ncbi:MAG: leucine-rich repeat domain-containing protein [Prevotella sp.]|nr:leucine-rich repeat domain-containing protein [Prevotella sp.]
MNKKVLLLILSFLTLTLSGQNVDNQRISATINGLKYLLDADSHEAIVANGNSWEGEFVIPSEVSYGGQAYTVRYISRMAFSDCQTLTKVTIPKTITGFSTASTDQVYCTNPFLRCSHLESIEVEEGNNYFCSVEGVLFTKDMSTLCSYPIGSNRTSYSTPNISEVGGNAFESCTNLQYVDLHPWITSVGEAAFRNCINLDNNLITRYLKKIGEQAFAGCKSLKLPHFVRVEEINEGAFMGSGIISVLLPNSLTTLGDKAFADCELLKSAYLPSSLPGVPDEAFCGCSSLTQVYLGYGIKTIANSVFSGCTSLNKLDFPASVYSIGTNAFNGCTFESLFIRGQLESSSFDNNIFGGMNTASAVYVPTSEVGRVQEICPVEVQSLDNYTSQFESLMTGERIWTMCSYNSYSATGKNYYEMRLGKDYVTLEDIPFNILYLRDYMNGAYGGWYGHSHVGYQDGRYYSFYFDDNHVYPIMDFNLQKGDVFQQYGQEYSTQPYIVTAVSDTIISNSTEKKVRKVIYLTNLRDPDDPERQEVWIEGVGSLNGGIMGTYNQAAIGGVYKVLKCTAHGNVLLENGSVPTDISTTLHHGKQHNGLKSFNLKGQQVPVLPSKGIVIQNDKKYIVK